MMKQEADLDSEKQIYLTCEKYYIFELLIFAAGMMGGIYLQSARRYVL